jgi:hypothetical protein
MEGSEEPQPPAAPPAAPQGPPPAQPMMGRGYGPGKGYFILILVGLIILMVGGIIVASVGLMDDPDPKDYDFDEQDDLAEDIEEYNDAVRSMNSVGNLIQYIGLLFFGLGVLIAVFKDSSLANNTKLGLLIALGLMIGLKIGQLIV